MLPQAISVHAHCGNSVIPAHKNINSYTCKGDSDIDMLKKHGCCIKPYLYMHIVVTLYLAMNMSTTTLAKED